MKAKQLLEKTIIYFWALVFFVRKYLLYLLPVISVIVWYVGGVEGVFFFLGGAFLTTITGLSRPPVEKLSEKDVIGVTDMFLINIMTEKTMLILHAAIDMLLIASVFRRKLNYVQDIILNFLADLNPEIDNNTKAQIYNFIKTTINEEETSTDILNES